MTKDDGKKTPDKEQPPPKATVRSAKATKRGVELVVRLQNPGDRAMHYISDVRVIKYDPAQKRLTVQLSDDGRTLFPGAAAMLPRFRVVDPNSEAEVKLELPETIVKLSDTPSPDGDVTFEEHRIADAAEVEVDIGWADTPFYHDPRESDDERLPAERWQQGKLHVSRKMTPRKK